MLEVPLSDTDTVRVDVCRLCHFVWFDAHETDTLVPRPPSSEPRIPASAYEAAALVNPNWTAILGNLLRLR
jgi:Zn-finger nucleic acid-binding protein